MGISGCSGDPQGGAWGLPLIDLGGSLGLTPGTEGDGAATGWAGPLRAGPPKTPEDTPRTPEDPRWCLEALQVVS